MDYTWKWNYSHLFTVIKIKFIILIDYLMKKTIEDTDSGEITHLRQSWRHPAKILNDLDFPDVLSCWSHLSQMYRLNLQEQLLQQNI